MSRLALTVACVMAALTLAGCGGDEASTTSDSGAAHNAADVMFAQQMVPHHEQAIAMAKLASTRSASSEVRALATRIKASQDPEITQMKRWLSAWDEPLTMTGGMGHGATSGMMGAGDMNDLRRLTGAAFDRRFLSSMRTHHRGAIQMARTEFADGTYQPATTLASDIIRTQSAQITTMDKLLRSAP